MTVPDKDRPAALVDTEALGVLEFEGAQESAWIEVIKKMDEVYSDLIRYEVDLEEKTPPWKTPSGLFPALSSPFPTFSSFATAVTTFCRSIRPCSM